MSGLLLHDLYMHTCSKSMVSSRVLALWDMCDVTGPTCAPLSRTVEQG